MKAVVFVDVQKDFIDGALRNEKAIEVTPKIVEYAKGLVVDLAPTAKLYATRDTHEKTEYEIHSGVIADFKEPSSGYMATLEGKMLPVEHCIEGTDGWMIDNRLMEVLDGHCTFVNKPTFGSFDLAEVIAEEFIDTKLDEIVLCGFCTDICVISNALLLRAKFPNTKISILKDYCAGVTEEAHEAALKVAQSCQISVL